MPRKIEFDEDAVMEAAIDEFRRHGYAGASISSLVRATGISSGSIYHSFGGKDALFAKSLDRYLDTVVRQRIEEHLQGASPQRGLKSLFVALLHEPNATSHGCLITNTAVEFAQEPFVSKRRVEVGFRLLETAFQNCIERWLDAQKVDPDSAFAQKHSTSAIKLLALYQGILVLFRAGHSHRSLRKLINNEIDQLFERKT